MWFEDFDPWTRFDILQLWLKCKFFSPISVWFSLKKMGISFSQKRPTVIVLFAPFLNRLWRKPCKRSKMSVAIGGEQVEKFFPERLKKTILCEILIYHTCRVGFLLEDIVKSNLVSMLRNSVSTLIALISTWVCEFLLSWQTFTKEQISWNRN